MIARILITTSPQESTKIKKDNLEGHQFVAGSQNHSSRMFASTLRNFFMNVKLLELNLDMLKPASFIVTAIKITKRF